MAVSIKSKYSQKLSYKKPKRKKGVVGKVGSGRMKGSKKRRSSSGY
jgi:hypothetical protein